MDVTYATAKISFRRAHHDDAAQKTLAESSVLLWKALTGLWLTQCKDEEATAPVLFCREFDESAAREQRPTSQPRGKGLQFLFSR